MKRNTLTKNNKKIIPIFYACDKNFCKFTAVSIKSLLDNANKDYYYKIYVLNNDIDDAEKAFINKQFSGEYFDIEFVNVQMQLDEMKIDLPLRDYYSKTTYYRMFIAKMFPNYDKAIYIDSDTVVVGDVSELFNTDIKNNLVGACHEQVMLQNKIFGDYVEEVVGVKRENYFNAGILLINCKLFRKEKILKKFINLLSEYKFVVTQDEDYLNVLCKDRVLFLNGGWNTEMYGKLVVGEEEIKIIHYIMVSKPWHYKDCVMNDAFWKYAKKTEYYEIIKAELDNYSDQERERDEQSAKRLEETALNEINRLDGYAKLQNAKDPSRLKVLEKIRQLEQKGIFDVDVEDDPETKILKSDQVDYLCKKTKNKVLTKIANRCAVSFYEKRIRKGDFIIKQINGIENYDKIKGGAIITCNHFNAFDNYAVWRAIRHKFPKGKRLYKIIREGNYTSFKGIYGFFFKHCNTLPLSSDYQTMKLFYESVEELLNRGERILIYPEQAMWWNYRKPRPLKIGAFKLASKFQKPVLPIFITMEDSDSVDKNGFPVQAYTINILEPIFPKSESSVKENANSLLNENFETWKKTYEKFYKIPLSYEA